MTTAPQRCKLTSARRRQRPLPGAAPHYAPGPLLIVNRIDSCNVMSMTRVTGTRRSEDDLG